MHILILELPSLLFFVILAYFIYSLFSSQINYFHTFHGICLVFLIFVLTPLIVFLLCTGLHASYLSQWLLKHTVLSVLSSAFLPAPSLTFPSLQPFLATIHTTVVLLTHIPLSILKFLNITLRKNQDQFILLFTLACVVLLTLLFCCLN